MPSRIEDYALIGDLGTAALVGRDGSIDWLCWPHFDSEACFAALLGEPKNGRARIAPKDKTARVTRRYRGDTLILETRFETADGVATLIDFMPPRSGEDSHLVRIVVGERGRVEFESELVLRFGYGAHVPWVTRLQDGTRRAIAGPDMVIMRTPVGTRGKDLTTVADFTVAAGERIPFVLSYAPSHLDPPAPVDPEECLAQTESFWKDWTGKSKISCPWNEAVCRSLITLKALTYAPTGGLVRGADHLAARIHRRRAQLGLPLLLAARRHADAARADERRLLRGGAGLARLAAARGDGQPVADPDHVRPARRAQADRMAGARGWRATRTRRRFASATPRTISVSSTSSAK